MKTARELVREVEENGGKLTVEGERLFVEPLALGQAFAEKLRPYKFEIISFLTRGGDDCTAWKKDFQKWKSARCACRPRHEDYASVSSLCVDFAEWAIANDGVPATREVFEKLLTDAGYVTRDGMVLGLLLLEDLDAVLGGRR